MTDMYAGDPPIFNPNFNTPINVPPIPEIPSMNWNEFGPITMPYSAFLQPLEYVFPQMNVKVMADDPKYLPVYSTGGAACADVFAKLDKPFPLSSRNIAIIDTGLSFEIPGGWQISVKTRSGMASKGIFVINSPGTIDADYRGKLFVMLGNVGKEIYMINPGDRIAQIGLHPVHKMIFEVVDKLSETERGEGGLGSTGK